MGFINFICELDLRLFKFVNIFILLKLNSQSSKVSNQNSLELLISKSSLRHFFVDDGLEKSFLARKLLRN